MKSTRKLQTIAGVAILPLLAAAAPAQALEQGDMLLRLGVAHVAPNDDSGDLTGVPNGKVSVGSATSLGVTFTYMLDSNLGVEVLGALPFTHEIKGEGALSGAGKIIETDQLPPTVMAVYHFAPKDSIRPYAGAGLNYTTFMNEEGVGALDGVDVSIDDSFGLALEAGVDIDINENMFFNASLWYIDIETEADVEGVGKVDVTIDPWVVMLGAGWRF